MTNRNDEKLEQVMTEALRGLPPRRAPAALESRVLDELQRRAALAWWRRSFMYWPAAARAAFVVLNVALVAATLVNGFAGVVGGRSVTEFGAQLLLWMRPFVAVLSSVGGLVTVLLDAIPTGWLYFGVALSAVLYVVLFGLGATVYRTLYLRPSMAGDGS
jgi:hypothetical protein